VLYNSTRRCNTAGRGARQGRPLVRVLHRLPARWIGERRRRAPTAHPSAPEALGGIGARQAVAGGGVAASGVHLALPRLVFRELPTDSRELLWCPPARARLLGFRFGCAAQRSGTRRCPGRPRRPRGAAAPRRMRNGHCARRSAAASTCTADGGGDLAGLMADSPQAQTAHPTRSWSFTSAPDATSDRTIRRLPRSAAQCSAVKPYLCTAGPRMRGWARRGYPQCPNRYPKTKQHAGPEGRPFWVNVNGREYCERTRSTRQLAPRSRIHQSCQTSESRGNGDCGRRRRREIGRLGKTAGERERTGHGT
jgi:hypothetical protein